MKALLFVVAAAALFAEEKSLTFTKLFAEQDRQEVATIVRSIADIGLVALDGNALKVSGTAQQVAAAEWIVRELDIPTGAVEHTLSADDVIRILEFNGAQAVQELQEAATLVRSMGQIRRLFTFNSSRKIVARGNKAQLDQAAWLLARLSGQAVSKPEELRIADEREPVLRMYTLRQSLNVQQFQETAVVLRSIAEIRFLFTYNVNRKLALRGTADQMAMVDFMLREFGVSGNTERHRVGKYSEYVRVFDASNVAGVDERATTMRSMLDLRRIFSYSPGRKIVVRGSREELDYCEWMMKDAAREFPLGLIRKFPLTFTSNAQELQEAATMLRSTGEIWRVLAENASKTVIVRGTQAEVDFAEWMFGQLASPPASGQAERKFGTDLVKLAFLKPTDIPLNDFFSKVTEARRASGIPRVFTYNSLRAVVMRGSAEQIAKAEALLR